MEAGAGARLLGSPSLPRTSRAPEQQQQQLCHSRAMLPSPPFKLIALTEQINFGEDGHTLACVSLPGRGCPGPQRYVAGGRDVRFRVRVQSNGDTLGWGTGAVRNAVRRTTVTLPESVFCELNLSAVYSYQNLPNCQGCKINLYPVMSCLF